MTTPNVLNTMIMEMFSLVAFKSHCITAATVIRAAWALVLAEMAATPDVVYGHMVSGRNLPLDGVESIMGPCLNVVPVHVNMNKMANVCTTTPDPTGKGCHSGWPCEQHHNGQVNGKFMQKMVDGINGAAGHVNGVHEEDPVLDVLLSWISSVSMDKRFLMWHI